LSTSSYVTSSSSVWCKTIVTTSIYIRSYNSFAPIPRVILSPRFDPSSQCRDNYGKIVLQYLWNGRIPKSFACIGHRDDCLIFIIFTAYFKEEFIVFSLLLSKNDTIGTPRRFLRLFSERTEMAELLRLTMSQWHCRCMSVLYSMFIHLVFRYQ